MRVKQIHILQHEPFEGAGLFYDWARENNHKLSVTELYKNEKLPALHSFDWLIIMGGGMSVNDEDQYTWLKPEKEFIKQAIHKGKIVIGICLGSQLIANAMGEPVFKNTEKEIGWFPVSFNSSVSNLFGEAWNNQTFFHWHGETYNLPKGCKRLATSAACKNQAFQYGETVFAFQFHPETNHQTLNQMVNTGAAELVKANYVMEPAEILAKQNHINETKPLIYGLLDKLAKVELVAPAMQ